MRVDTLYRAGLRLYPRDYRSRFGAEMRAAFEAAAGDARQGGTRRYLRVLAAEAGALTAGAVHEWVVKLISDPTARARTFPDCRYMRPVGLTRAEWAAGLDDAR
jgi:hypothetical protein